MVHGMSLSSVLGEIGVNEMDKIISDWDGENSWHWNAVSDLILTVMLVDRDNRS